MFYSLTDDIIFKNFFELNKSYLKILINNILHLNIIESEISFINPSVRGMNKLYKSCEYDIAIKLSTGEFIIIEMQNNNLDLVERFEYYVSRKYSEQLKSGDSYRLLKKVHGIFFVNCKNTYYTNLFTRLHDFDTISMKEKRSVVTKDIINLTKYSYDDSMSKEFNLLLKFMTLKNEKEMREMVYTEEFLEDAYETVKRLNTDPVINQYILSRDMREFDFNTRYQNAIEEGLKNGVQLGIEQGIEQGIEKGIEKGIEQGIEKGHLEEKIDIAKNLLREKLSINFIVKTTNLTLEQVKSIEI